MKKNATIAIATLLLFGCQKAAIKSPEKHVIDSGIVSEVKTGDTTTFTYRKTDVVLKITDAGKGFIIKEGKRIEVASKLETDNKGIKTFSLLDTEGNVYYSIKVNTENQFGFFKSEKLIPFEQLEQHSGMQSIQSAYALCMRDALDKCGSLWYCYAACETTLAGLAGCTLGWAVGCYAIN